MIKNLDEIKETIKRKDPTSVLSAIGYAKSAPHQSAGEIRDYCPIHGGENQKSLAIRINDGAFTCHNGECGAKGGDNIALYQLAKKCDFMTAIEDLAGHFGIHIERNDEVTGKNKRKSAPFASSSAPNDEKTAQKKDERDEKKLQLSKLKADEIWNKSTPEGSHPYFERKGIKAPANIRFGTDEKGNAAIVVPYRDVEGAIQAIQFINDTGKFFAKDTTPSGAFLEFGLLQGSRIAYLCEGIATAASIRESENNGIPTLSCGTASNIPKVAKAIKEKFPEIKLIVCLDDDKAGDETARKVEDLDLSNVSFRRPDFTGMERGERDKDFNDLHRLIGAEEVRRQLKEERLSTQAEAERSAALSTGLVSIWTIETYFQNVPPGVDIGLKTGSGEHDKILLPSGGYTVFCAPTKHGKTAALVNAVERHLWKDPAASAVFISLEELEPPIFLRFLSRFMDEEFSKDNASTLASYFRSKESRFAMFSTNWKWESDDDSSTQVFQRNVKTFEKNYLATGRLRILSFNSLGGSLSQIEQLCKKVEGFKKWIPGLRMVAIDYLQLLGMQKPGNRSRDEVLKEVCLQLKDVAARTGLAIVTAAQFNRTIQNEDDLHPSAIGEAGSIERHASLALGMWNRKFTQMIGGKPDSKKGIADEILLSIMLNRHGPSGQKFVIPYNGNIGRVDFEKARLDDEKTFSAKKKESRQNSPLYGDDS